MGNTIIFPKLASFELTVRQCQVREMGKLSLYARNRVISLQSSGVNITKITDILREEGVTTSRSSVNLFLSRYRRSGSLQDAPRSGRKQNLNERPVA